MAPMAKWASGGESDEELFVGLSRSISARVPGFKIRYKNESKWQWFLSRLLFFIRGNRYMTEFTTTLGNTVWFPSEKWVRENYWKAFKVLAHEYVHLLDRRRYPRLFELMYMFPLWIVLPAFASIAAIYSPWFLFALVFLVALLPWPAFTRANLEMRGYSMSIAINMWRYGSIKQETRDWIVEMFTGWDYYRMWPRAAEVHAWIRNTEDLVLAIDRVKTKETIFVLSEAFEDVYELLTGIEHSREGIE